MLKKLAGLVAVKKLIQNRRMKGRARRGSRGTPNPNLPSNPSLNDPRYGIR